MKRKAETSLARPINSEMPKPSRPSQSSPERKGHDYPAIRTALPSRAEVDEEGGNHLENVRAVPNLSKAHE